MNGEHHQQRDTEVSIHFDHRQFKELMTVANKLVDLLAAKDQAVIDNLTNQLRTLNRELGKTVQQQGE